MDSFKTIYKILVFLERSLDVSDPDLEPISADALGITAERWTAYMEMLTDSGYIKGLQVKRYISGEVIIMGKPKITLSGMQYLQENSVMQRCYKITKGIADLIP